MNLKNKIKFTLFTAIFILLFLLSIYYVSAGCCVKSDECVTSTLYECSDIGIYNTSECDVLSQCIVGCCCQSTSPYATTATSILKSNCGNLTNFQEGYLTDCYTLCNPSLNKYNVSGYIKNSTGGFVSGATVTNTYDASQSITTTATGYYSFNNVYASILSPLRITATKSGCTAPALEISNLTANKINQNISLSCISCYWIYGSWEECDLTTRISTREVTGNSSPTCTLAQLGPKILTQSCTVESKCGDSILEDPEQCEINWTKFDIGIESLILKSEQSCSFAECISCQCTNHEQPEEACFIDSGNFTLTADYVKYSLELGLKWTASIPACTKFVDHFTLEKCEANAGATCVPSGNALNLDGPLATAYTDTELKPEKTYCYKLTINYDEQYVENTNIEFKNITQCFYSGDSYCFEGNVDPNCITDANGRNGIISCDSKNKNITTLCTASSEDNPGQYCTFVNNQPVCKNQTSCERCNAFFGLFGFQGISIYLKTGDEDTIDCPSINYETNLDMGCYLDYTKTSVDMSKQCGEVKSCYDYFSEEACEGDDNDDSCQKIEACEWIPYNKQFNKGVCRPINQENQNCSLCTEDANNRFYEDCTKDTCVLYGGNSTKTSCYFDGDDCLNKYQMACSNYVSSEDCIGPINKQQNVSFDVTWSDSSFTKRTGITNNLLELSNDALNLGRCKWIEETEDCIKDADGNNSEDCIYSNNAKQKKCKNDFLPPNTTIEYKEAYNRYIDLTENLFVDDNNVWFFKETTNNPAIALYYCINISTPNCYPTIKINKTSSSPYKYWIEVPDTLNDGTYSLFYYAEDPARNLEVVKNFTFDLDTIPPNMSITRYYHVTRTGNDYRSDITFNITLVNETHRPVTCSFSLTEDVYHGLYWLKYYNIFSQQIFNNRGTLATTYPDLIDGWYDYYFDCYDIADNHNIFNDTFFIEGDMRINSATPSNRVFRIDALPNEISLKTENVARCRYSDSSSPDATIYYSNMSVSNRFTNTTCGQNCYYHNASMPLTSPQKSTSGVHLFYTACNITQTGFEPEIVQGDPADWIYFSIDEMAPKTTFNAIAIDLENPSYDEDGNKEYINSIQYNVSKTTNNLNIDFVCNDSDSLLYLTGAISKDMSFGCNKTYYCLQNTSQNTSDNSEKKCDNLVNYELYSEQIDLNYLLETDTSYYTQYGNYPTLCYYSIDNGGNIEEEKHCTTLNIKNTRFDKPIITIQIPDEETTEQIPDDETTDDGGIVHPRDKLKQQ